MLRLNAVAADFNSSKVQLKYEGVDLFKSIAEKKTSFWVQLKYEGVDLKALATTLFQFLKGSIKVQHIIALAQEKGFNSSKVQLKSDRLPDQNPCQ